MFDESFANLNTTNKLDAAFLELENAFGKPYANRIRELYDSANHSFFKSSVDLGEFKVNPVTNQPIIELNKSFGNAKIMANTILHEVRHLRHFLKTGGTFQAWKVVGEFPAERFATATNITQGKALGIALEDLGIFEDYYWYYRGVNQ